MEILDEFERANQASQHGLLINEASYPYLWMAARWGQILAIIGFVLSGLGVLIGIAVMANAKDLVDSDVMPMSGMWVFTIVYYVFLGFYFMPLLYLNRFASHLKSALRGYSQQNVELSFKNLGNLFKFLGILTLVSIGLYFLLYAGIIAFAVSMSAF